MDNACELPETNPQPEEIREILEESRRIAVVGLSPKPERDSHRVAMYLQEEGYEVIPVNPGQDEILGETSYKSVSDLPERVDVVCIFRKPEAIPPIVDEAIAHGARTVWMQEGLAHNRSADKARAAGLRVVMSRCMMKEHRRAKEAAAG